jgi:dTDP-4-amino-4,6-dideoxygalactose transaminase
VTPGASPDIVPFVDLAAQYRCIEAEVNAAMQRVLARCDFILGTEVEEFEAAFAGFVGAGFAIGVSSGLDALRLVLQALDIGPGDEVILPANSYVASAFAVSAVGARPVLVDCDPDSYNIDPGAIAAAVTARSKAIMPVHLTGQAADMDPILALARRHGLHVVEDAAQAHGTSYKGRLCGSVGIAGAFSFYPGKNLGAYGDAGLVTTSDAALAQRLRRLRNYGQEAKYHHVGKGLNARLDTVQAAVLGVKLKHLAAWNGRRAENATHYRAALAGVGDLRFQARSDFSTHIYHLFIVESGRRDDLRRHLDGAGIQTGIHYPIPIHLQPAYAELGYGRGDFPEAERLASRALSLPMYAELTEAQVERVSQAIRHFFGRNAA